MPQSSRSMRDWRPRVTEPIVPFSESHESDWVSVANQILPSFGRGCSLGSFALSLFANNLLRKVLTVPTMNFELPLLQKHKVQHQMGSGCILHILN